MAEVILAGALGATLTLLILTYRRNLTLARYERERAKLRQIINTPRSSYNAATEPVRRKRHLEMYRGGAAAAAVLALGAGLRSIWHGHRPLGYTVTAAAAGVAVAVAVYVASGGHNGDQGLGDPPVGAPPVTLPPDGGLTPGPSPSSPDAGASRTTPHGTPSTSPPDATRVGEESSLAAGPSANGGRGTALPSEEADAGAGGGNDSPPVVETPTPDEPPPADGTSAPDRTPTVPAAPEPAGRGDGVCVVASLPPLVDLDLCLL